MSPSPIQQYLKAVERALALGNATEHTHRPALKTLIESFSPRTTATNEPSRIECGAPDFTITRTPGPVTIGYVEAKDVGTSLDEAERSPQLKRYLHALNNLVLTDYLEFCWYVDGQLRCAARLARPGRGGKLTRESNGEEAVAGLLNAFLSHSPQEISTPKGLAERMARLTHIIRDIIVEAYQKDKASPSLCSLRQAFAQVLIPDLGRPERTAEFADMYAQTIAYGLFAARCNHEGTKPFQRLGAASEIPKTNPLLRKIFESITGTELDGEPYAGFVDDLVQLLAYADIPAILKDFGKRTRRQDPVVHFYETFLAEYDPALRESRGVYYTPLPVVSYIVRSVDAALSKRFSLAAGLADAATVEYQRLANGKNGNPPKKVKGLAHRVLILDPACGTGTFLYSVVDHIREQFMHRGDAGMWSGYVKQHLLPRLFGFELLMAPYAVAHFKLSLQLAGQDLSEAQRKQWAYDFTGDERLAVYLTNTLEEVERRVETLFGPLRVITEEANAAARIKKDLPIMVILGNPPYSGQSANRSWEIKEGKRVPTFIGGLLRDYYQLDGEPLKEKNPKWLQDDYVKFIRWAQWRIERTGAGVLAFITNHSYLDNPTFCGMRQALMNAFTEIRVLDLHGSTKRERPPEGVAADKNVFDIQQGVAIGIFIRQPGHHGAGKVYHADLWGSREEKYKYLLEHEAESTAWEQLAPKSPFYFFVPQDTNLQVEYDKGWKLTDIFPTNSLGIVTARDELTIRWSRDEVWDTIRDFLTLQPEKAREKYELGKDAQDWRVSLAQNDLRSSGPDRSRIAPILYRPFDLRFTYYSGNSRGFICRPRPEVMYHMLAGENKGLLVCRQTVSDSWQHVLATNYIADNCCVSNKTRERSYALPLYLYPRSGRGGRGAQAHLLDESPIPDAKDGRGLVPILETTS
jgi:predicted helicase